MAGLAGTQTAEEWEAPGSQQTDNHWWGGGMGVTQGESWGVSTPQ